jgi:hypothetical protein
MRKRACGDLVSVVRASWPPVVVTVSFYRNITQRVRDARYSNPLSGRGSCGSDRAQHRNNRPEVVAKYSVPVAMPSMQKTASVEAKRRLGRKGYKPRVEII